MKNALELILASKKVAVWGLGYLGYTTVLKLQSRGFFSKIYDFDPARAEGVLNGKYPSAEQSVSWSSTGNIPALDAGKIEISASERDMFSDDTPVHILSHPATHSGGPENGNLLKLAEIFKHNAIEGKKPLVLFQSASIPGSINKFFIEPLGDKINFYNIGTSFRSDWSIEEFLASSDAVSCSAVTSDGLKILRAFFELLGVSTRPLCTIKEAELLENAKNGIQYAITSFVNQLALAYPDTNLNEISDIILSNPNIKKCRPGIGSGGYRMPAALDNIIYGSSYPNALSLIKESQFVNISTMISYCEYIKRHKYSTVVILGISYSGNQKELGLSPSLVIAETLLKSGADVKIHDPLYSCDEISGLLSGISYFEYEQMDFHGVDVVIVASEHTGYKYLTQRDIEKFLNGKVKLVIDSSNSWNHYKFNGGTVYHQIGDGTVDVLS